MSHFSASLHIGSLHFVLLQPSFILRSCSLPLCHPLAAAASLDIILCNLFPLQKFLAMVASKVWPSFSLKGIDVKLVCILTSSVHTAHVVRILVEGAMP